MLAHPQTIVQQLLDAKTLIEEALNDATPEERLQTIGLLLLGPARSDKAPAPRPGNKADQLIEMLRRPQGATLDDIMKAFPMKKNSAYARISVETRRRNLRVERRDGVYHIA